MSGWQYTSRAPSMRPKCACGQWPEEAAAQTHKHSESCKITIAVPHRHRKTHPGPAVSPRGGPGHSAAHDSSACNRRMDKVYSSPIQKNGSIRGLQCRAARRSLPLPAAAQGALEDPLATRVHVGREAIRSLSSCGYGNTQRAHMCWEFLSREGW